MRSLDKYIIFTSIFSLFSENFNFHYIIDWKIFYVFLISNLVLLLVRNKTIFIHTTILFILGFFLVHGLISYFFLENPIRALFSQLIGIALSSIFYYNLLKTYKTNRLFNSYLSFSFYLALLAILLYLLGFNLGTRLKGILTEPAHYAAIMLPATYVFLRNKNYLKFSILLVTILLSRSSIGYLGLVLILLIPLFKIRYFLRYSLVTIIVLGLGTFYISSKWNDTTNEGVNEIVRRLKETKQSLKSMDTGKFKPETNLSSYALLSNTFISRKIIKDKPLGVGLGAYPYEYDKYYSLITPPPYLEKLQLSKINKTDANSLFLRGLADFGLFWFIFVLFFVYISFKLFGKEDYIRQSTFFYLIVKLIREGHYFPPEFYFFLLIFLKDFNEDIAHR